MNSDYLRVNLGDGVNWGKWCFYYYCVDWVKEWVDRVMVVGSGKGKNWIGLGVYSWTLVV